MMTAHRDEDMIYGEYQNILSTFRLAANGQGALDELNALAARAMVCSRHRVTHTEFDEIITRKDVGLKMLKAREGFAKNPAPCSCGSVERVNVHWDPFEAEMYSNDRLVISCFSCYRDARQGIKH